MLLRNTANFASNKAGTPLSEGLEKQKSPVVRRPRGWKDR
jgi:hypothetical protein